MPSSSTYVNAVLFVKLTSINLCAGTAITPVEKVMELLEGLQSNIESEGKDEAVHYDKFACFCKSEADRLRHGFEETTKKQDFKKAHLDLLEAESTKLSGEVSRFYARLEDSRDSREDAKVKWEKSDEKIAKGIEKAEDVKAALKTVLDEKQESLTAAQEYEKKIAGRKATLESRLEDLQNSNAPQAEQDKVQNEIDDLDAKSSVAKDRTAAQQSGKDEAQKAHDEAEFLERGKQTFLHAGNDPDDSLSAQQRKDLQDVTQSVKASHVATEQIAHLLQKVQSDMTSFQNEMQASKDKNREYYEGLIEQAHRDMKRSRQKIEKLSAVLATKDTEAVQLRAELDPGIAKTLTALTDEMKALSTKCETKASQYDKRTEARSTELAALAAVLKELSTNTQKQYNVNKKLNLMARKGTARAATFLQLRARERLELRTQRNEKSAVSQPEERVVSWIAESAKRLGSTTLELLALKMRANNEPDMFDKLRDLILKNIAELQTQRDTHKTESETCAQDMEQTVKDVTKTKISINDVTIKLSSLKAQKKEDQEAVADLQAQIQDQQMAKSESAAQNKKANVDYEDVKKHAEEGVDSITAAQNILKPIYSFRQDPDPKFRDGFAPDQLDEDYQFKNGAANGINGMLEVIKGDFERTKSTAQADQTSDNAAELFFQKRCDDVIKYLRKKEDSLATDIATNASNQITEETNLETDKENLEGYLTTKGLLEKKCFDQTGHLERRAQQERMIQALQDAMKMLEDLAA